MVKRILHLVLALVVVLSLSACATRNNQGNNRVGTNNNGTDTQRLNQENTNNVTYRDGVYTGYGDPHANGNEAATVEIRNGRIANIDLINVGQQGGANNAAGTGRNNQTGTGTGMGTGTTTPGTGGGTTAPGITGNQTGTGTTTPNATGDGTTGTGNAPTPKNTTGNTTGTGMGTRTGTGTGITGGNATDAINGVRTRLVNAMIRDQRYDVTIDNNDTALAGTINNWKLAVRRALDQAR